MKGDYNHEREQKDRKAGVTIIVFVAVVMAFLLIVALWQARPERSTRDLRDDPPATSGPLDQ